VAQSGNDGNTPSELLRRADERMYRAKQEGRNRVCAD
jgi:PleD family two-component response regulator